ncbi:MAG: twin-arginine translocase TatA/TatE family subunit [Thermoanaerobaculaceae bacterium]|nr:twin-arginine translocase TatA/TatE family subunit [Thermoanaerobaculaceae bacterium]
MFGTIGMPELLIILLILLLLFGAAKLPQLGGALGKTIKNFKKEMKEESSEKPSLKCPKCQTDIEEDVNFCPKCGEKLK